jgi:hypothetical protein
MCNGLAAIIVTTNALALFNQTECLSQKSFPARGWTQGFYLVPLREIFLLHENRPGYTGCPADSDFFFFKMSHE